MSRFSQTSLSKQISYLAFALAAALIVLLAGFGWWAASNIDDRAVARETRAVLEGLRDARERIPQQQDSAIAWDEAVSKVRAGDDAWIAENLAEWMSNFFGHERIYLLDPHDRLVRAVANGQLADPGAFYRDAPTIGPLVVQLRRQMAEASAGLTDSTAAIAGLGVENIVILGDGSPAIVSVRPVRPGTTAVSQAPGTEYLHVSAKLLAASLARDISTKFEVRELTFTAGDADAAGTTLPVRNNEGQIVGAFTWSPDEPAYELIRETAPALLGCIALVTLGLGLLLRRLRRTSTLLENSKAHASFLAFHDPLTGIPNRALFEDRLDQALAGMRRTGQPMALHYVDLDRFKHVNDTLGHPAGDSLIREAARRLSSLVDEVDTVARLGGDEFAVIQASPKDMADALSLAQAIVDAFGQPFDLSGSQARVGASVGVVVTADGTAVAEELMRQADIALYEAKDSGRGRYRLFAGELDEAVRDRRALELDLRAALNGGGGLTLMYQPIWRTRSNAIAGAEALVRWDHPTRGRLSPASFVSLAEERGLIDQLGMWVLREACAFAARSSLPWVAVNVSPLQFRDEHFAEHVFEALASAGLKAKRLEIEITEGLLLQNSPTVRATLMQLRAKGIRVALDDFGTGYSSISYLRNHGIDKLKIDQSFTAQLGRNAEIDSIVHSIINLGRAMHMVVTAEGVETHAQRRLLAKMGCDQLQGYLLSAPLSPPALDECLTHVSAPLQHVG